MNSQTITYQDLHYLATTKGFPGGFPLQYMVVCDLTFHVSSITHILYSHSSY